MFNGEDVYRQLGGDYATMLRRLKNDALIQSFMEDFLREGSFSALEQAMASHDNVAAFEAAHALKGITLNMEFGDLAGAVSELTEALRGGRKPEADKLYDRVKEEYEHAVTVIRQGIVD